MWIVFHLLISLLPLAVVFCVERNIVPVFSGYISYLLTLLVSCLYPHFIETRSDPPPMAGLVKSLALFLIILFAFTFPIYSLMAWIQPCVAQNLALFMLIPFVLTTVVTMWLSYRAIERLVQDSHAQQCFRAADATRQRVEDFKKDL
jgi:hypothetical protein